MEKEAWFKDWFNSPYYHQLYVHRNDEEAAGFINRLISHLQPPQGAKMLDVACGKGRHSIQLAAKGFDVTGIDLSEESIEAALQSESETLHFFRHDMRLPFWMNYFHFAFNFFTSFGYFNTARENHNAIRTIAQSLQTGGTLVIDYLNVADVAARMIPFEEQVIEGVKFSISKWMDDRFFYKKIVVVDAQLEQPLSYTEKVAKFELAHFTAMLAEQQMEVKEVFGDYFFKDFDAGKSPRLIVIAQKK
ncbi:MAG: hypothetical protein RLY16_65 [Bacteroidota bacterium]|jgi:SAM-dependent methyltransferase